jgi:lipopolysaccharide/colanic/teichoic acid biosynthesis glycosyltransferase
MNKMVWRTALIKGWSYINRDWYRLFGKRLIDLTLSSLLMIVLLPIYALVAAAIWVSLGRPVFFRHRRPGLNERMFTMLKFRTMSSTCDASGMLLPDHMRLTRLGQVLRATSLDEIPELWNVFRGDMSLVGPRPLLEEYLPFYTARQRRRHAVRPGITGLAQVRGRNLTTWRRRLALDAFYVDHQSLALDLKICAATFTTVIRSDGGAASVQRLDDLAENARLKGSF